ncbi:MAG: outer membrane protein assembly factor BamC [Thiotrichales bacterium]
MHGVYWIALTAMLAMVVGCGTLRGTEDEAYLDSRGVSALKAPPALVVPEPDPTYQIPGAQAGVTAPKPASRPPALDAAPSSSPPVATAPRSASRIESEGQLSWVRSDLAPDRIWEPLRVFWRDQQVKLAEDRPDTGVMRTEWITEGPSLSQSQLQTAVEQISSSSAQGPVRHQYRIRVERTPTGSNVYLTYQGARLVRGADGKPAWQLLPANTELETSMLQRLNQHLARR